MKESIIIYGAGKYGKALYHLFKRNGINVKYFCQTICDEESYYDDVKIINMQQLFEMSMKMIIFIAIGDLQVSRQIKEKLLNMNKGNIQIYECGSFITQNRLEMNGKEKCYCNLCGNCVDKFRQYEWNKSTLCMEHRVSGGAGVRENEKCPACGSIARMRWQYWVLGRYTKIFTHKCSVLHIAPEPLITTRIQSNELCDYYTGNIVYTPRNRHIVDVTNIQFVDNFFDYIIMHHVLEHIENEAKAISELKRVLKPDGKLILSFPICMDIDTYEDSSINTEEERLQKFGQEDHVRIYGKDYITILEKYALNVKVYSPQYECSKEEMDRYGFSYDDVNLICTI